MYVKANGNTSEAEKTGERLSRAMEYLLYIAGGYRLNIPRRELKGVLEEAARISNYSVNDMILPGDQPGTLIIGEKGIKALEMFLNSGEDYLRQDKDGGEHTEGDIFLDWGDLEKTAISEKLYFYLSDKGKTIMREEVTKELTNPIVKEAGLKRNVLFHLRDENRHAVRLSVFLKLLKALYGETPDNIRRIKDSIYAEIEALSAGRATERVEIAGLSGERKFPIRFSAGLLFWFGFVVSAFTYSIPEKAGIRLRLHQRKEVKGEKRLERRRAVSSFKRLHYEIWAYASKEKIQSVQSDFLIPLAIINMLSAVHGIDFGNPGSVFEFAGKCDKPLRDAFVSGCSTGLLETNKVEHKTRIEELLNTHGFVPLPEVRSPPVEKKESVKKGNTISSHEQPEQGSGTKKRGKRVKLRRTTAKTVKEQANPAVKLLLQSSANPDSKSEVKGRIGMGTQTVVKAQTSSTSSSFHKQPEQGSGTEERGKMIKSRRITGNTVKGRAKPALKLPSQSSAIQDSSPAGQPSHGCSIKKQKLSPFMKIILDLMQFYKVHQEIVEKVDYERDTLERVISYFEEAGVGREEVFLSLKKYIREEKGSFREIGAQTFSRDNFLKFIVTFLQASDLSLKDCHKEGLKSLYFGAPVEFKGRDFLLDPQVCEFFGLGSFAITMRSRRPHDIKVTVIGGGDKELFKALFGEELVTGFKADGGRQESEPAELTGISAEAPFINDLKIRERRDVLGRGRFVEAKDGGSLIISGAESFSNKPGVNKIHIPYSGGDLFMLPKRKTVFNFSGAHGAGIYLAGSEESIGFVGYRMTPEIVTVDNIVIYDKRAQGIGTVVLGWFVELSESNNRSFFLSGIKNPLDIRIMRKVLPDAWIVDKLGNKEVLLSAVDSLNRNYVVLLDGLVSLCWRHLEVSVRDGKIFSVMDGSRYYTVDSLQLNVGENRYLAIQNGYLTVIDAQGNVVPESVVWYSSGWEFVGIFKRSEAAVPAGNDGGRIKETKGLLLPITSADMQKVITKVVTYKDIRSEWEKYYRVISALEQYYSDSGKITGPPAVLFYNPAAKKIRILPFLRNEEDVCFTKEEKSLLTASPYNFHESEIRETEYFILHLSSLTQELHLPAYTGEEILAWGYRFEMFDWFRDVYSCEITLSSMTVRQKEDFIDKYLNKMSAVAETMRGYDKSLVSRRLKAVFDETISKLIEDSRCGAISEPVSEILKDAPFSQISDVKVLRNAIELFLLNEAWAKDDVVNHALYEEIPEIRLSMLIRNIKSVRILKRILKQNESCIRKNRRFFLSGDIEEFISYGMNSLYNSMGVFKLESLLDRHSDRLLTLSDAEKAAMELYLSDLADVLLTIHRYLMISVVLPKSPAPERNKFCVIDNRKERLPEALLDSLKGFDGGRTDAALPPGEKAKKKYIFYEKIKWFVSNPSLFAEDNPRCHSETTNFAKDNPPLCTGSESEVRGVVLRKGEDGGNVTSGLYEKVRLFRKDPSLFAEDNPRCPFDIRGK
ncbi:MAG: hypothetical protein WC583_05910, partial [Candidatus Omnitrophota bacterium]